MSWRWIFALVAVPGLILGILMYFVIREPNKRKPRPQAGQCAYFGERNGWDGRRCFKSRNIVISMAALFCAMTGVFVLERHCLPVVSHRLT